ncbi:MAG: hypothetical protein U0234_11095 [Sandaracinus sp.]
MAHDARILFCPFCRECFEGETRCPEHELALVPFDELPRNLEDAEADLPRDDQSLPPFDFRFGRGWVTAGALAFVASFAMTFVQIRVQGDARGFTAMEAASAQAPNLWTVPFVGVFLIAILGRRRSLAKMRSARLSVLLLGLAPLFAIGYSYFHVLEGAAQQAAHSHGAPLDVSPGLGILVAAVGSALVMAGARRLGYVARPVHGPSRADLDVRSPIDAGAPPRDRQ